MHTTRTDPRAAGALDTSAARPRRARVTGAAPSADAVVQEFTLLELLRANARCARALTKGFDPRPALRVFAQGARAVSHRGHADAPRLELTRMRADAHAERTKPAPASPGRAAPPRRLG